MYLCPTRRSALERRAEQPGWCLIRFKVEIEGIAQFLQGFSIVEINFFSFRREGYRPVHGARIEIQIPNLFGQ